jgi:hypothetical protein
MLRYKKGMSLHPYLFHSFYSLAIGLYILFSDVSSALIALVSAPLFYLIPTLITTKPFTIIVGPIFTYFKAPRRYGQNALQM